MSKVKAKSETPLMKQYNSIKSKHPDALLLFRVGDFYETFGKDAITASNVLGITLTARNNGSSKIELAGFPHHSIGNYLPKLVKSGHRVAVCDQLEQPTKGKKIVKRGVTELVTPGIALTEQLLDSKGNNFLAAVSFSKGKAGIAFLDISTGEFYVGQGDINYISKLVNDFSPSEILYSRNKESLFQDNFQSKAYTFRLDDWVFQNDFALEKLNIQFGTKTLKGFGISNMDLAIIAAGAVLHYITTAEHHHTSHVASIQRIEKGKHLWMDDFTVSNLELIYSTSYNGHTLVEVLDQTSTAMGARLLKKWLLFPLISAEKIRDRLEMVEFFINNSELFEFIKGQFKEIGDLERMSSRLAVLKTSPRELNQLKKSLQSIIPVKEKLLFLDKKQLNFWANNLKDNSKTIQKIEEVLHEDAPIAVGKGQIVKDGFHNELDELRNLLSDAKSVLLDIQKREIEKTGIPSLKIAFNNVFGYFIEVRNTHKDKVPELWIRKQTLTSAERYVTEELKIYEEKILGAEDKILKLESEIYSQLIKDLLPNIEEIVFNAKCIAYLDVIHGLAHVSKINNYSKPVINDGLKIDIKDGRHPVIEQFLPVGEAYIPNDIFLDNKQQQIMMITGPNMSGKSALLRQTALVLIMAQIGCFVPAKSAEIGVIDKLFTRVGANDNISSGESTFMVEMNETSSIMNNISSRSLILLDEIGRGTSTYDGISIAWSIAEFLHENPKFQPKTMFATHYHELNNMTKSFNRIKNYNVSVKEIDKKIHFIRKLIDGGSEHSFGIHVAKVAGMPKKIISKAEKILKNLELENPQNTKKDISTIENEDQQQLSFFQLDDPILSDIRNEIDNLDVNSLTPVEALVLLNNIKKKLGS
ncbi:MAG: DNA mismatch repair protein MutS [Crocinitomicaceae bacterium]|nr:DNA mismatch repair protein MutS [Crocinitomicaceae bacterium]